MYETLTTFICNLQVLTCHQNQTKMRRIGLVFSIRSLGLPNLDEKGGNPNNVILINCINDPIITLFIKTC